MWKFIKHEWKFWLRSPMTWIFFGINAILVLGAVSSDSIMIGGSIGSIKKNAPFIIQFYYGIMSLICLLMTTAYMNATANRDFQYNMYQFVFSSPIKQTHYFFGKFIGAASISIIPLLGISLGALLAPMMPWSDPQRIGPVYWSGHINGLLCYAIPNTIITGAVLYSLAILYRSTIVSFIGAMGILVLYGMAAGFTTDIEKEWLSVLVDPFGFRPASIISKYFTVDEKNTRSIPLTGLFMLNRVLWIGISFFIIVFSYFRFSFATKKEKKDLKKVHLKKDKEVGIIPNVKSNPVFVADYSSRPSYFQAICFETKTILRNPTFIIIAAIGMINLLVSGINKNRCLFARRVQCN